jgi:UDP:flavonoid glycosyltransferase YjiC (YdhE family)
MGPAAGIAGSFGFTAEYLPSHSTLDVDVGEWDSWFQAELEQKLDIYGASLIVYDGNAPTDGLVRAAGGRDAGLVWVRNGMIGRARMPLIGNAGYCTMVIEPRDLAGGLDFGETAQRADEAVAVDPILLFEPEELLPRAEAAAALGLDPGKPAILIQLGSGSNRDILGIIDRVVRALAAAPDVQVCVGGWSNAAPLPDLWQRVQPLRGFPFTRYLRAFDFAISAAGYSSFHETIGYAVPTIFVPNRHASMDDQVARAAFAEGEGMALQLDDRRPDDVQAMVKTLLAEPARAFLAENCRKAAFRGGAEDAARLIGEAIG